jgi:SH3 domain-containing YSC84-like protein 1
MTDPSSPRGSVAGLAGCLSGPRCTHIAPLVLILLAAVLASSSSALAQTAEDARLAAAGAVLNEVMLDPDQSIPPELLQRAHGIAIFPSVVRGGFIVGARRGRGVLVVRAADGRWSNPTFITLTSGSIGWQVGAQSADVILIFANERSVNNIASGRFTLGGDASVVAGPVGRHATAAATFRAEVYAYQRSRGLFAGAAFEGVRLGIDADSARRYYASQSARPLAVRGPTTPDSAARFLQTLERAESADMTSAGSGAPAGAPGAITYPLGD